MKQLAERMVMPAMMGKRWTCVSNWSVTVLVLNNSLNFYLLKLLSGISVTVRNKCLHCQL
mgnify:CR=1 FL=1